MQTAEVVLDVLRERGAALLDAGADVRGIARTDEFAYSIAGRNPHYGTPPNAAKALSIPSNQCSWRSPAKARTWMRRE